MGEWWFQARLKWGCPAVKKYAYWNDSSKRNRACIMSRRLCWRAFVYGESMHYDWLEGKARCILKWLTACPLADLWQWKLIAYIYQCSQLITWWNICQKISQHKAMHRKNGETLPGKKRATNIFDMGLWPLRLPLPQEVFRLRTGWGGHV